MAIATDLGGARSWKPSLPVVIVAGAVVAELVLGLAVARGYGTLAIAAALAGVGALAVVRFPFMAVCLVFVLGVSVFGEEIPGVPVGGNVIYLFELLLGLLLLLAIARPRRHTWGGPIGLALGLFLGVLVLSVLVSAGSGNATLNEIIRGGRGYFMLTIFWVVLRLFPERRQVLRLLVVAAAVGAATGVVALLLAVGLPPGALGLEPNSAAYQIGSSIARVRLSGLAFAFAFVWLVILFLVNGERPRWLWWLCIAGMGANILVSLNRNMWVAGLFALAMMLLLTGSQTRGRAVTAAVAIVAAFATLALLPPTRAAVESAARPLFARAETLLDPARLLKEESLQDRVRENEAAWAVASDNLLFGIAPGVPFGVYLREYVGRTIRYEPQTFVHNQYLYLLLITGVPGLLLFVLFAGGAAITGMRASRARPEIRVLGIAIAALLLTGTVMLSLSDGNYLIALALAAAAVVALRDPPRDLELVR